MNRLPPEAPGDDIGLLQLVAGKRCDGLISVVEVAEYFEEDLC